MKWKIHSLIICVASSLALICHASRMTEQSPGMSEKEALKLGTEAYIYGYPLITMDATKRVMTNAVNPSGGLMGQFINMQEYPNPSNHNVTSPNADTLYSVAWLDLSKGPYILHVPDANGRYYLMPMLSGWTEVFAAPGTRTTGTKAHDFAIVGPHWRGRLPRGIERLKSPTDIVWIIGRTYCTGTPEDYQAVHALQDEYKLTPLSAYHTSYTSPKGVVNPVINMKTTVRDQVNAMSAAIYFKRLAKLMKTNPPARDDAPMLATLAQIGIEPGKDFDITKLDPAVANALNEAVKAAQDQIMSHGKNSGVTKNGWNFSLKTGQYDTDYLQRAYIAAIGLGANRPQDAIYPIAKVDSSGKNLNGINQYVIHFAPGQTPPVNAFWSLTMYNNQYFFVANPLNRYSLSPRNNLKSNKDGSIDLYIQNISPGKDKESNWLPAPMGDFVLMFRLYWPKQEVIDGQWIPPEIKQVLVEPKHYE